MVWVKANPTTFTWMSPRGRMVLQRLDGQRRVVRNNITQIVTAPHYILSAFEHPQVQLARLTINGAENEEINVKLESLYNAIISLVDKTGLDFLKSLLPP